MSKRIMNERGSDGDANAGSLPRRDSHEPDVAPPATVEGWRLTWRQTPRTEPDWTALGGLRPGRNACFADWTALAGLVVRDS